MADTDKKEFEAKLDADPRVEMTKASKDYIDGDKDLKKLVTNFKFSEKVELDKRKWSKSSLADGVLAIARYEMKVFATAIGDMAKKKVPAKEAGPRIKTLHAKLQKDITKKLSLAVEELANDKADNKKALKDGKVAMSKIGGLDLKGAFSKPRTDVIGLMDTIAKAKDNAAASAVKKANDAVSKLAGEFDKTGREASAAINYLLKVIKENKKSETTELRNFANLADDNSDVFQTFVDECKEFEDALDGLAKELGSGKLDADAAKAKAAQFKKMSNIDSSADKALKAAVALKKNFDSVVKALK